MTTVIQDVGEGSKLWRLVTGINQRRVMSGLQPRRYSGTAWEDVDDLASAGVETGAIVQATAFWLGLQEMAYLLRYNNVVFINPPANGSAYDGDQSIDTVAAPDSTDVFRAYHLDKQERTSADTVLGFLSASSLIRADDIIGEWLLDDMLVLIAPLQWVQPSKGATASGASTGLSSGSGSSCSAAYARAVDNWRYESRDGLLTPGIYYTEIRASVTGDQVVVSSLQTDEGAPLTALLSDRFSGQTYTLPDGVTADLHHAVLYSGDNYTPIGSAPVVPGLYTVATAQGPSITALPVNYAYNGQFPASVLGASCASPGSRDFVAEHHVVARCSFADLA